MGRQIDRKTGQHKDRNNEKKADWKRGRQKERKKERRKERRPENCIREKKEGLQAGRQEKEHTAKQRQEI